MPPRRRRARCEVSMTKERGSVENLKREKVYCGPARASVDGMVILMAPLLSVRKVEPFGVMVRDRPLTEA